MLVCMYLCALDKFKPVFTHYMFNISWIRNTVLLTEIFLSFSKMSKFSVNPMSPIQQKIFWSFVYTTISMIEIFNCKILGACILQGLQCDGKIDCLGEEDEHPEICDKKSRNLDSSPGPKLTQESNKKPSQQPCLENEFQCPSKFEN